MPSRSVSTSVTGAGVGGSSASRSQPTSASTSVVAKLARGRAAKPSRLRWRQLELVPDRSLGEREQFVV
jgi:hypothetical protein